MQNKRRKRNKLLPLLGFSLIVFIIVGIISWKSTDKKTAEINATFATVNNAYEKATEIYNEDYQNAIYEQVQTLKSNDNYTIDNPLLISNPYSTVTNGLYVYFRTSKAQQIQYVISVDGYKDFTQIAAAKAEDSLSKEHEFMMIGLIPGELNKVTVKALDSSGKVQNTVSFEYDCPKVLGEYNINQIEVESGTSAKELSNGLYAILGNDIQMDMNNEDIDAAYLSMYDNDGVLRVEIPCVSYRAHRLIFDENGMYYSVSGGRIARMDSTGYVNRIYKLGNVTLHHDYIFGGNNDLIVLGTDKSVGTKEDVVFSIDLDTKEVTTLLDYKDILPDYYAMSSKPENAEWLDWIHFNSIQLVGDDSLILSARETSTIIKMDDIYGEKTIDAMFGSDNFWEGTGYEQYLYTPVGEFSLHAGQHSVVYQEDETLNEGEYYLYMFNNNNTISTTRPDYDWSADDNYYNTGIGGKSNGQSSYYYKYLVNTSDRTYTLVDSIPVAYSGFVSSVQEYENNIIIDAGGERFVYEFDENNELIQKMTIFGNYWVYRTLKYDFSGYWFQ